MNAVFLFRNGIDCGLINYQMLWS